MNVDRDILRGLTAKQFAGWQHFSQLEPFGQRRADYHAAQIVAAIANSIPVPRGKRRKAVTIEDALLKFKEVEVEEGKPQKKLGPVDDQKRMLNLLTIMAHIQAGAVQHGEAKD